MSKISPEGDECKDFCPKSLPPVHAPMTTSGQRWPAMQETSRDFLKRASFEQPAHTLQDQLVANLEKLLAERNASLIHDQANNTVAFAVDESWAGQHARLINTKGWEPV